MPIHLFVCIVSGDIRFNSDIRIGIWSEKSGSACPYFWFSQVIWNWFSRRRLAKLGRITSVCFMKLDLKLGSFSWCNEKSNQIPGSRVYHPITGNRAPPFWPALAEVASVCLTQSQSAAPLLLCPVCVCVFVNMLVRSRFWLRSSAVVHVSVQHTQRLIVRVAGVWPLEVSLRPSVQR